MYDSEVQNLDYRQLENTKHVQQLKAMGCCGHVGMCCGCSGTHLSSKSAAAGLTQPDECRSLLDFLQKDLSRYDDRLFNVWLT